MNTRKDNISHSKQRICDHPGCREEGTFRAPKDRTLRSYYWFCLKHVQEYNKNWNYYAGLSADEIEREIREDLVGHRPTWKVNHLHSKRFKDPFNLFEDILPQKPEAGRQKEKKTPFLATLDHINAIKTLKLTPPVTLASVKKSYKALAKKHHPDMNGGDKQSEEIFKEITKAYHLLCQAFKD